MEEVLLGGKDKVAAEREGGKREREGRSPYLYGKGWRGAQMDSGNMVAIVLTTGLGDPDANTWASLAFSISWNRYPVDPEG
jgi:hypothetical protein